MFRARASLRPILQMELAECGAACLAMVLGAHGRVVALEEARERCDTSRDGVDAAALTRAAESYGLCVKALRREPEMLAGLPLPAILHWSFNHFVVLEAAAGRHFTILDPAAGRRNVDADEMGRCFTGLALAAVPGPEFVQGGKSRSIVEALIAQAEGSWDAIALVFVCGIAGIVPGLALSGAVAVFTDHVLGQGRTVWLLYVLAGVALATILQAALGALREWTVASLKAKIAVVVAARALHHALFLPLAFFAQRHAGEVVSRLRVGSELGATVAGPLAQMPPNAVTALGYILTIGLYDWALGAVVAALSLINLFVLNGLARRLADSNRLQHVLEAKAGGIAAAGFASLDAFRMLGRQELLARRWLDAEEAALNAEQRLGLMRIVAELGPVAAALSVVTAVLCVGAFRVIQGDLTLGGLLALQVLAGLCAMPIAAIAADFCQLQEAAGALTRLDDLHQHPQDGLVVRDDVTPPAAGPRQGLKLENVSFGFGAGAKLFDGINLTIEPGTLTALVGASGVGKSTLAKIAAGLVAPRQGSVQLDGISIEAWSRSQLRSRLLYVPQASAVFTGSLAENITLWDENVPHGDIAVALQMAGADQVVAGRRGGLATQLTQHAPGFSGGEVQRLALARALARKPDVLILDETTSALDALCEEEVISGLRRSGAAVLIVTHRVGTEARCDRTVRLTGDGGLIEIERPCRERPVAVAAELASRKFA
jgi:ABC-type bacteriocin/lantibiotic exporter with double-glycine peptidase domain